MAVSAPAGVLLGSTEESAGALEGGAEQAESAKAKAAAAAGVRVCVIVPARNQQ
jgi:hypothetical protein